MKISIFGSGYVGLVQAAIFADVGHRVICADLDEARGKHLKQAHVPFFEPALEGADTLVICTEWKAFWSPDFELDQVHPPGAGDHRRAQPLQPGLYGRTGHRILRYGAGAQPQSWQLTRIGYASLERLLLYSKDCAQPQPGAR